MLLLQVIDILMVAVFAPESRLQPDQRQAFNRLLAYATAAIDER